MIKNYYGNLCTEMYEILHEQAPQDELEFYLSYAKANQKILEPLCGSGRFLIPFSNKGLDITGIDLSSEMLNKLKDKTSNSKLIQANILDYSSEETYDYIFISSGSVSLFTDMNECKSILKKIKSMLSPNGIFVFAVDTVFDKCNEDDDYKVKISAKTKEGYDLVLKGKNHYDQNSQTQFSPSIYELYDGCKLIQSEVMDFQTHLYLYGEMEKYLREVGFKNIKCYSSYNKEIASHDNCEMFLFECH